MSYYIGLSTLSNKGAGRKKLLSAEARRILSKFEGAHFDEENMEKSGQGRPFLPGHAVDFNIAHSGSMAAVSLVRGGAMRTGCDIERIRPRLRAHDIAKNYYSAAERKYLYQQGKFSDSRFYEIWTLKECYIKLRGLSVFDMNDCPSFVNDNEEPAFCAAVSSPLSFRLYELSDGGDERYILATAIEGEQQVQPEILWFSQSSLACKMTAEINAAPSPAETVSPKM